jgi:glycosyltransferase involved in cell wall biosynthesis
MRVYLEGRIPGWKLHSLYGSLISNPPDGFDFLTSKTELGSKDGSLLRVVDKYLSGYQRVKAALDFVKPMLYYTYYRAMNHGGRHAGADLVYSSQHLIFDEIPWVVDVEFVTGLVGYGRLRGYERILERTLSSKFCKKIMPWTGAGRDTLIKNLNCKPFENKIETVHLAVPPKRFVKKAQDSKTRLLFVGTGNTFNIRRSFELKGGRELLLAFERLRKKYENVELTIRSYVPHEYWDFCAREEVRILPDTLSFDQLGHEFEQADIFIFPGHQTPGTVILDAMSYELPVVATDVWATREMVLDGRTGLLTKASRFANYYESDFVPRWGEPDFWRSIARIDPAMIEDIVVKASYLLENPGAGRQMGRNGRHEIETGRFSLLERNRKLSRIFRESLGN